MTPIEFHTGYTPIPKKKHHDDGKVEEYHIYDCPFCERAEKIFYFPETTTWDCKVCGKSGNVHTFNQHIYNSVCNGKIRDLRELWKLPVRVFSQVRYNPLNGTYVIPSFNKGRLNNLYKYVPSINKCFGTPGLKATLIRLEEKEEYETVWLVEGQKDTLAGMAVVGTHEIEVIGLPGAHMFRPGYIQALEGRNVVLVLDNDEPGEKGIDKILSIIKESQIKPLDIKRVVWEDKPDGYDLYDHYQEHKGRAYAELRTIAVTEDNLTKVTSNTVVADDSCDSLEKFMSVMEDTYLITKDMRYAINLVLASIYSTNIEGEQVWVKLIARPGAGKSTIAKVMSASDYVVNMSTFTGIFSGHRDQDDSDPSMVPLIANRTLIVKDADALLRQKNIEQIMSELRDFYDKDSVVRYRNRQEFNYQNVRSTFIMMGTQVLRRSDQSFLGERLLTLDMDVTEREEAEILERVTVNAIAQGLGQKRTTAEDAMAAAAGFIGHLKERDTEGVSLPEKYVAQLGRFSTLAANMRTMVDRDQKRRLQSPAVAELGTRIIGQMISMTISLCVVRNLEEPDDFIKRLTKKVLLDSINPRSKRFIICDFLVDRPGSTRDQICEGTKLKKTLVEEELADLLELGFAKIQIRDSTNLHGGKVRGISLISKIAEPFREILE